MTFADFLNNGLRLRESTEAEVALAACVPQRVVERWKLGLDRPFEDEAHRIAQLWEFPWRQVRELLR